MVGVKWASVNRPNQISFSLPGRGAGSSVMGGHLGLNLGKATVYQMRSKKQDLHPGRLIHYPVRPQWEVTEAVTFFQFLTNCPVC